MTLLLLLLRLFKKKNAVIILFDDDADVENDNERRRRSSNGKISSRSQVSHKTYYFVMTNDGRPVLYSGVDRLRTTLLRQ